MNTSSWILGKYIPLCFFVFSDVFDVWWCGKKRDMTEREREAY
jgi:hypothetical protein